uniref:Sushi, von Willebrand factor type A, EGF and pentraxin domain-containing protein 1-like n=1 Tax=Strongyloides venezuelensis TaxID=75913 RepID=A0A0K0FR40_STRVS
MTSFSRELLTFTFLLMALLLNDEYMIYGVQVPSNSTSNTTSIPLVSLNSTIVKEKITFCSQLPDVPNGKLRFSTTIVNNTFIHGTVATLTCNSEYTHIGNLMSTCIEGTNWTKIGTCVKKDDIDCLPINITCENGYVLYESSSPTNLMKIGTVAELHCNTKSIPSGNTKIKCTQTGWEKGKEFGNCTLKEDIRRLKRDSEGTLNINTQLTCPQLFVAHGRIQYLYDGGNYSDNYPYGTSGVLICDPGYEAIGVTLILCTNGVWNPTIGYCRVFSNVDFFGNSFTTPSTDYLKRNRRQVTLPSIFNFGTTVTGSCYLPLPFVLGGTISYGNNQLFPPYSPGTVATLTCTNGVATGALTATCIDGTWSSSSLGPCNSTSTNPLNVLVTTSPLSVSCAVPAASGLGGYISYTSGAGPFPHMTVATLTCDIGATVSGASTITCMNGVWTPATLGKCVDPTVNNLFGTTTIGLGNLINPTTASLTTEQCLSGVIDPLNGRISYSSGTTFGPFPAGTVATLICNTGYTPLTAYTSTCTNGVFTPQTIVPTCITDTTSTITGLTNGSCFALASPLLGTITYSLPISSTTLQYSVGTVATLTCNSGYIVTGTGTSTCTSSGWLPFGLGTCTVVG